MMRPVAFVLAWLLLCGAVGYSAYQTDQLVQENRAAIEENQYQTCGTWLSIFILANQGIAPQLPPKDGQALRERLAADFKSKCADYVQDFP
jgi:hypothetical protein